MSSMCLEKWVVKDLILLPENSENMYILPPKLQHSGASPALFTPPKPRQILPYEYGTLLPHFHLSTFDSYPVYSLTGTFLRKKQKPYEIFD